MYTVYIILYYYYFDTAAFRSPRRCREQTLESFYNARANIAAGSGVLYSVFSVMYIYYIFYTVRVYTCVILLQYGRVRLRCCGALHHSIRLLDFANGNNNIKSRKRRAHTATTEYVPTSRRSAPLYRLFLSWQNILCGDDCRCFFCSWEHNIRVCSSSRYRYDKLIY